MRATIVALLLVMTATAVAAADGDDWVWAEEGGGAVAVRAMYASRQPPKTASTDEPFAPYVQRVLSAACCRDGRQFNAATAMCELPPQPLPRPRPPTGPQEDNGLATRSGLTSLPPNCPPGQKYDSESKICRDVWGAQ